MIELIVFLGLLPFLGAEETFKWLAIYLVGIATIGGFSYALALYILLPDTETEAKIKELNTLASLVFLYIFSGIMSFATYYVLKNGDGKLTASVAILFLATWSPIIARTVCRIYAVVKRKMRSSVLF